MAKENGVKHCTKAREHQVNCQVQKVEDRGKRGGSKGHPYSHLHGAHRDEGLGFFGRESEEFFFFFFSFTV